MSASRKSQSGNGNALPAYTVKIDPIREVAELQLAGSESVEIGLEAYAGFTSILGTTKFKPNTLRDLAEAFTALASMTSSESSAPATKNKSSSSAAATSGTAVTEEAPKRRGRPPKNAIVPAPAPSKTPRKAKSTSKTEATANTSGEETKDVNVGSSTTETPKRRGRTPKTAAAPVADGSSSKSPKSGKTSTKKASAPKTTATTSVSEAAPTSLNETPRRRGRPSKNEAVKGTKATGKKATKAASKTSPKSNSKPRGKALPVPVQQSEKPDWFTAMQEIYTSQPEGGSPFTVTQTPLQLDPQFPRKVIGAAPDEASTNGWGYEARSGDQHLAWVIAEKADAFYLVADGETEDPARQKSIHSVLARIAVKMSRWLEAAEKAA